MRTAKACVRCVCACVSVFDMHTDRHLYTCVHICVGIESGGDKTFVGAHDRTCKHVARSRSLRLEESVERGIGLRQRTQWRLLAVDLESTANSLLRNTACVVLGFLHLDWRCVRTCACKRADSRRQPTQSIVNRMQDSSCQARPARLGQPCAQRQVLMHYSYSRWTHKKITLHVPPVPRKSVKSRERAAPHEPRIQARSG